MRQYAKTVASTASGFEFNFSVIDAENQPVSELPCSSNNHLLMNWNYDDLCKFKECQERYFYDCGLTSEQICKLLQISNATIYHNNDIMLDAEHLLTNMPPGSTLIMSAPVMLSWPYEYIYQYYNDYYYKTELVKNGILIKRYSNASFSASRNS